MKSDSDLINKAIAGDIEAYGELAKRYEAMLLNAVYAVTGDFHAAQEIVQDALLKCYAKIAELKTPEAFAGWARQAALNLAKNAVRVRKHTTVLLSNESSYISDDGISSLDSLAQEEEFCRMAQSIDKLSEYDRAIFLARFAQERQVTELAEEFGVTKGAISKRLGQIRAKLRQSLFPELSESDLEKGGEDAKG